MTHSPSQSTPPQEHSGIQGFLTSLHELWVSFESDREERTSAHLKLEKLQALGSLLYGLATYLHGAVSEAQQMIQHDEWGEVDTLARETWDHAQLAITTFAAEHLDAVAWFELVEHLDDHVITWLTHPTQTERVRGLLDSVEGRADQLIGHGIDLVFSQVDDGSPLTKLLHYREDIERWIAFLVERILPKY